LKAQGFSTKSLMQKALESSVKKPADKNDFGAELKSLQKVAAVVGLEIASDLASLIGMSKEESLEYGTKKAIEGGLLPPSAKGIATSAATKQQRLYDAERAKRAGGVARARLGPVQGLGEMGMEVAGIGQAEAAQRAAAIMQAGGGVYTGSRGQAGFMKQAMAAQTAFGGDSGTSGAFLQAGRRGGLVGGQGRSGASLRGALQDAMRLGLEGSEITEYLAQMAQGIQAWESTGIQLNKDSIRSMGMEMTGAGISGVRAGKLAGGFQGYLQNIGKKGLSGGLDLLAMQSFGGFKGGGSDDYVKAIMQMEQGIAGGVEGITSGSPMGKFVQNLYQKSGGGLGGAKFVRGQLGKMQMDMSMSEAVGLMESLTGEELISGEDRKRLMGGVNVGGERARGAKGALAAGKIGTAGGLNSAAKDIINKRGANLRKAAGIENQSLAIGARMAPSILALEKSAGNVNSAFVSLTTGTLTNFSNSIEELTVKFKKIVDSPGGIMKGFLGVLMAG
jgi:hypothetical protein